MIGNAPFIGIEAEGPDRGKRTFFVPKGGTATIGVDKAVSIVKENGISRVYFGAGEQFGMDKVDFELVVVLSKEVDFPFHFLCEVDSIELLEGIAETVEHELLALIPFVLVVKSKSATARVIRHLKFVNENELFWHKFERPVINQINDVLYKTDMEVT